MPVIKGFEINKDEPGAELGRGNFGVVYKAKHVEDGTIVAAKEIKLSGGEDAISRIKREIDILKRIPTHENIVGYLGSAVEGNMLWVFMEYCPLKDLDDYCEKNDIQQLIRCDIMIQIIHALKHIHGLKNPIAHRDIKPENILIIQKDGNIIAKLSDFGTSKIADETKLFTTFAGTHVYMAPELFKVLDHYGVDGVTIEYGLEVDIFSSGLLFYDFFVAAKRLIIPPLANKMPIGRLNNAQEIKAMFEDASTDTAAKLALNSLVRKMTAYNPKERPTLEEIETSLNKVKDKLEKQVTIEKLFPPVHCDISPLTQAGQHSKQPLVKYDLTHCTLEEDSEVEGDKFNLASSQDLIVYDACKTTIGPEMSKPPCDLLKTHPNLISYTQEGCFKLQGQVSYKYLSKYMYTTEDFPEISSAASEFLLKIEKEIASSKQNALRLAQTFFETFDSHFLVGSYVLGSLFEYLIISFSDVDPNLFKMINRDISRILKNKSLDGNTVGIWYNADEILDELAIKKHKEHLHDFHVRVTKFSETNQPESQCSWEESIQNSNKEVSLDLISLSHESDVEIVPIWEHPGVSSNWQLVTTLTEAFKHVIDRIAYKDDASTNMIAKADLVNKLGIEKYMGDTKIGLHDVMSIKTEKHPKHATFCNVPFLLVEKILTVDHRARDQVLNFCSGEDETTANEIFSTKAESNPHPVDIFFLVFQCCDPVLQQSLLKKMFLCRLAVPLIIPTGDSLQWCIWPLETIVVECSKKDTKEMIESSLLHHPFEIISFMRFGSPTFSKSKLMNEILSETRHDSFCNYDSQNGQNVRYISDGLVEMTHYLPSGKDKDHFRQELLFLNLRGDCLKHPKQLDLLIKISSAVVLILNVEEVSSLHDHLNQIYNKRTIILLVSTKPPPPQVVQEVSRISAHSAFSSVAFISTSTTHRVKSISEVKTEIRNKVNEILKTSYKGESLFKHAVNTTNDTVKIDEDNISRCTETKKRASDTVASYVKLPIAKYKDEILPLQGSFWKKWALLQKKKYRAKETSMGTQSIHAVKERIQRKMDDLRIEQRKACFDLGTLSMVFVNGLMRLDSLFLHFIKLELDTLTRTILPPLLRKYKAQWDNCREKRNKPSKNGKSFEDEKLLSLEKDLAESSLGFEHLMREVGQLYEANINHPQTIDYIERLPMKAASLLEHGIPFEIMDGDTACIPLTWVMAVFECLAMKLGNKKMFVLSVIGIQSSGKSTFLNAMFGCEFAVSAGRCTRGVYAQLVPVKEGSGLSFDYLLILDSEGLRAPELSGQKFYHDNELATLVIGLADLTIINLKGENTAEMKDVLQIAVHAFLRMKIADIYKKQRCMFVHQNIDAASASDKMVYGLKKLQENLDQITLEAAEAISCDAFSFNDVIKFRGEKDVWYMPNLWAGEPPPMAHVNPAYSEKVIESKNALIQQICKEEINILPVSHFLYRVRDMWNGILSDDFVFSFRNSRAITAYLSLERKLSELKHELRDEITNGQLVAIGLIRKCANEDELNLRTAEAIKGVEKAKEDSLQIVLKKLEKFYEATEYHDILIDVKEKKIRMIEDQANQSKNDSITELKSFRDKQYNTAFKYLMEKEKHKKWVMETAMEHAKLLKGDHCLSPPEIDKMFETFWEQIDDIGRKIVPAYVIEAEMIMYECRKLCFEENILPVEKFLSVLENKKEQTMKTKNEEQTSSIILVEKDFSADTDYTMDYNFYQFIAKGSASKKLVEYLNSEVLCAVPKKVADFCNSTSLSVFANCEKFVVEIFSRIQNCRNISRDNGQISLTAQGIAKVLKKIITYAADIYKSKCARDTSEARKVPDDIMQTLESSLLEEFDHMGFYNHALRLLDENRNISYEEVKKRLKSGGVKMEKVTAILLAVDLKMLTICIEDSGFTKPLGSNLVGELMNQFKKERNMSSDLKVLIAILAIRKASEKFATMHQRFDARHSNALQMQEYKEEVRTNFHNTMTNCTKTVAAANVFCTIVKHVMLDHVKAVMSKNMEKEILQDIGHTKFDLIVKIMKHLLKSKERNSYLSYISNAYNYALDWMQNKIDEKAFGSEGRYRHQVDIEVQSLIHFCKSCVNESSLSSEETPWVLIANSFISKMSRKLSIHESDFNSMNIRGVNKIEFKNIVLDNIAEMETNIKLYFSEEYHETGDWKDRNPYMKVTKDLWGCREQCPFCNEPCMKSDPNHKDDHQCIQHRPKGVKGGYWHKTKKLMIETCTACVASDFTFGCRGENCPCEGKESKDHEGWIWHPFKQYRKYKKGWEIAPDNADEGSAYWKWFFCTFKDDLVRYHGKEQPDIPKSWFKITETMAQESIHEYEGLSKSKT